MTRAPVERRHREAAAKYVDLQVEDELAQLLADMEQAGHGEGYGIGLAEGYRIGRSDAAPHWLPFDQDKFEHWGEEMLFLTRQGSVYFNCTIENSRHEWNCLRDSWKEDEEAVWLKDVTHYCRGAVPPMPEVK